MGGGVNIRMYDNNVCMIRCYVYMYVLGKLGAKSPLTRRVVPLWIRLSDANWNDQLGFLSGILLK